MWRRLIRALRQLGTPAGHSTSAISTAEVDADRATPEATSPAVDFGLWDEESLSAMSADELFAWENRNIGPLGRESDRVEAIADERQDLTTSLNFPLHWTTVRESWNYLFDFAVASDLLAPRPDDLVLDLAAGTCWATEFLARVGVRTVSIDLSLEMMRRGRDRLAVDSRLVLRRDARFVAARAQSLPFADSAFDGVICLNALHHVPDYGALLREVYRVLKRGGRAVFSEPGTAHAAQALSQFRMREETVIEKSVSLPLVRRLAREAGFTRMRVVPLRSSSTYAFDYGGTEADVTALRQMWADTLLHSPAEHARFGLYKGDDRVADTLQPAGQLVGRLRANIQLLEVTPVSKATEAFVDSLRVRNDGAVIWKAQGRRFGGQVSCALKVCSPAGEVLREDLGRTSLPYDVAPGEEVAVQMRVAGELPPGSYELRYDLVVEGVTWFEFDGSSCPRRTLQVTPNDTGA